MKNPVAKHSWHRAKVFKDKTKYNRKIDKALKQKAFLMFERP